MVKIENIYFSYRKNTPLFSGLSLSLEAGHIYGLLGRNGSGKSTLLKNIAGLAFPQSGHCYVNGVDSTKRKVSTLEQIYFLPEEVYVPSLTAGQFLRSTAGFYPKFDTKEFYHYLKILDVDESLVMNNMSYGEQKKVMIAFGLATQTNLLIMDEPTNGLDIPSKTQFRKLMASLVNDERCIIISTHQVRDLDSLIDFLLILDNRRIVVESPMDRLAEKLGFVTVQDTRDMKVLYQEKSMLGNHAIIDNSQGKYSKIDLELLFNGVTSGSMPLLETLKDNHHE
jgi:ABC-2 type transport system ATP-binding protein